MRLALGPAPLSPRPGAYALKGRRIVDATKDKRSGAMFPLAQTEGDEPGTMPPDRWPTATDLAWVEARVQEGRGAVDALSFALYHLHDPWFNKETDGEKHKLSVQDYGALQLYLDAIEQAAAGIASDVERSRVKLDEIKWECVDLDGADDA
jgi:hypothetical protein